ncbi:MAG: mechanosensitive ion channel protein MscS, partial [Cyanobium sp.]
MKELLLDVLGWLGYLERPVVQLQLLVSLGLIVLSRQARRRRWLGSRLPSRAVPHVGQLLLALACLLLATLGQPIGLAVLLGLLWLGWSALGLLTLLLGRWLPPAELHRLDTRLLRPVYLGVAALLLISEVTSLHDLAVIPLGHWLGVRLTTDKVVHALAVIYLVLVGCGPPAAGIAWLLQRALDMSDGSRKATELMLRYTVVGLGLVAVAVNLGLNTTALIAVAGGLSVGLGFGIKEVFSNFVSGL